MSITNEKAFEEAIEQSMITILKSLIGNNIKN